jgi:hypothetical protein
MNDGREFRREMILRILGWGMAVHLLVIGYSVSHSDLFELWIPDPTLFLALDAAQMKQIQILEDDAKALWGSSECGDTQKAVYLDVQAAQIKMDMLLAQEKRKDNWYRAVFLIAGVLLYSIVYPVGIWLTYQRTDPGLTATGEDFISLRTALTYGIVMSLITLLVAFLTAWL